MKEIRNILIKVLIISIISIVLMNICFSQEYKNYRDINEMWIKFCQAYDSLDYHLMADIHSKNLIRIPNGKRIMYYECHIQKLKANFEKSRTENSTKSISLRFFERINSDSIANERGVFKFVRNKNQPNEKISYGKFHVLLIKENGNWRILMDYDTNEGGTVGEKDFKKAFEMIDFKKFIKEP